MLVLLRNQVQAHLIGRPVTNSQNQEVVSLGTNVSSAIVVLQQKNQLRAVGIVNQNSMCVTIC